MGRGEISWKGHSEEGTKREVYAHRVGKNWDFFVREKRFDQWAVLKDPPLDDWLLLLDGVRRRVARRLMRPEEEPRLKKTINELFPEAKV